MPTDLSSVLTGAHKRALGVADMPQHEFSNTPYSMAKPKGRASITIEPSAGSPGVVDKTQQEKPPSPLIPNPPPKGWSADVGQPWADYKRPYEKL